MIANGTIIDGTFAPKGAAEAGETSHGVALMAVALQWHVTSNAAEPVALATARSAETGAGTRDVVLIVADCTRCKVHDTRVASALARTIFDEYTARQTLAESAAAPSGAGATPTDATRSEWARDKIEIAQRLAESIITGLKAVTADAYAFGAPADATHQSAPDEPMPTVVATVIHRDTLFVARFGAGRVYLLRNDALENLTDEGFVTGHAAKLEPDLGQLELLGEDRVLLCTEGLNHQLTDVQIRNVLRSTPAARRAAQALLDGATREDPSDVVAIAVADYVTGRGGVFPTTPVAAVPAPTPAGPRRGTFRGLAAAIGLLILVAAAATGIWALSNRGGGGAIIAPAATAAPAEPTLGAIVPVTATATATSTPTARPTTTPTTMPTPTATPEPTATATPEPTATPTSRPTRRPPTATPTPLPPTETPIPTPTLVVTETPQSQNTGGGGGGGSGGGEQPPAAPNPCDPAMGIICVP